MAKAGYQYETSPKKLIPDYEEENNQRIKNKKVVAKKVSKELSRKQKVKMISCIVLLFIMMLVIGYRNSLIDEKYDEIKKLQVSLETLEKVNKQTEVSIERNVNLKTIKELAEGLGMQALDSSQTVNIDLNKQDYIEASTEEVQIEKEETGWFENIIESISQIFKK